MNIGLDLIGGDNSPLIIAQATFQLSKIYKNYNFFLFGTEDVISSIKQTSTNIHFISSKFSIEMQDNPVDCFKNKYDSSLFKGLNYLKDKKIDIYLSSGNSGAIVLGSALILERAKSMKTLAFITSFDINNRKILLLDVGATLNIDHESLFDFAKFSSRYFKKIFNLKPKVSLLNIGEESIKGTKTLRDAYKLLSQENNEFTFIGNIEPDEFFNSSCEIIVTGGFTGNIFIKSIEGCLNYLSRKNNIKHNLDKFSNAILLGVKDIVIKCHGKSNVNSIINGIEKGINLFKKNINDIYKL